MILTPSIVSLMKANHASCGDACKGLEIVYEDIIDTLDLLWAVDEAVGKFIDIGRKTGLRSLAFRDVEDARASLHIRVEQDRRSHEVPKETRGD